jgi:hypothetical protein
VDRGAARLAGRPVFSECVSHSLRVTPGLANVVRGRNLASVPPSLAPCLEAGKCGAPERVSRVSPDQGDPVAALFLVVTVVREPAVGDLEGAVVDHRGQPAKVVTPHCFELFRESVVGGRSRLMNAAVTQPERRGV